MSAPAVEGAATAPAGTEGTPQGQTPQVTPPTTPETPSGSSQTPSGTEGEQGHDAEYWKKRARENEQRAKANSEAAKELEKIREGQKTAEQKAADQAARVQRERDEAIAESRRLRSAVAHKVSVDNFDLLGTGTEEEIEARAQRVGQLEAAAVELAQLKAQLAQQNGQQQQQLQEQQRVNGTIPVLQPGSTSPQGDDSYPESWFPGLNNSNKPTGGPVQSTRE